MRFLWMFIVVFSVSCDDITLSTITPRDNTEYLKHTLPRITRSNNGDGENANNTAVDTPLDLLRGKDVNLRRTAEDIWAWDLYCHMQPMKGTCKQEITRYYYDSQLDSCSEFKYSGCHGNNNNFATILDCERRCKGANFMGVHEKRLPTVCYLQADSGLCLAFIQNYYYDVNSRACLEFTYGGCGGNLNRFDTKADCELMCKISKKTTTTKTTTTTTTTTTTQPTPST